jgi:hypothetical protein
MTLNLINTANFTGPYIQYAPLFAGLGGEPAVSIASMIRNSLLSAPQTWYFNRNTATFATVAGTQDYTEAAILDMGFIEKCTIQDDQGNIIEIKDIYNNQSLAQSAFEQQPSAISLQSADPVAGCVFRFLGVPDQIYIVEITYQKAAPQFGPFFITAVAAAVGGNTAYTGTFDTLSLPTGASVVITMLAAGNNNGTFTVVSVTPTTLTVNNGAGTLATAQTGYVANYSWAPIPDTFSDIYNNLFLSEAFSMADDVRSAQYRQRGIAAFLSKATGLTDTQKNAFTQQWSARGNERASTSMSIQQGTQARGV